MEGLQVNKNKELLSHIAKDKILEYIERKELASGDLLPSENQFVDMLGVSRITVREALAQLTQEGIVYKIQGKGTFLKRKPVKMENGLEILKSPTEIMESFGYHPVTEYLPTLIQKPDKEIREKLELDSGERIVTYRRKRYADGKLAVFGVDSMPEKYFQGNIPEKLPRESMLNFVEKDLDLNIDYARTEIIPVLISKKMAELIGVKEKSIFLLLNQLHFDLSGNPVIYSLDYFNTAVFKFIINRKRKKEG